MANCKSWFVCCVVALGLLGAVALICLGVAFFAVQGCPSGSFGRAAVSADSWICSKAGRSMLQQGGSAVDGAIAALLCTSVVNPQSMGIGGGSMFTIRSKTGNVKFFNFREVVPKSFKENLLNDCPTTFRMSPGSQWIGVPGELRGYEEVHKQYGKLPWAKLFEPSIQLARGGIEMPPYLAKLLNNSFVKNLVEKSSLCKILCDKNRIVLGKGDILKFPKLAETMETIAEKGADALYTGEIGQDLIKDIKDAGGTLEMEDLKSFHVRVEDAWTVPLGNIRMHIPPPPSGGALLAFILALMKEFLPNQSSLDVYQKTQMYHHYIEAAKFANGLKRSIFDPKFNKTKSANHLIDPNFINHIRAKIVSNRTHDVSYYAVKPSSDRFGTTHVSVLDVDGLAVSATSTINEIFGGTIYSPRTGIILNNELTDFCGRADTVRAGEQPPSAMTPAILETQSGGLLVIGGSGGSMITSAVALSIINHLWLGMTLKDAIAVPIAFVDSQNNVKFEPGFNTSVIDGLKALGHKVADTPYFFNVVNAVEKEDGCIAAISDSRKMGVPAGY
ncbi:glutathione hydrolase 5 proenzyme [Brachionichthys hirsutus]|uniref:glutathione hydrolase 5 proenzyme n=1 Tax=Brachionichthys hirsutus TaxID=412623 RepID=UPI003604FEA4